MEPGHEPESPLELRVLALLRKAGLPRPVCQHEVRDRGSLIARLDLAYPDVKLAIEADGARYHSSLPDWRTDLRRRNALTSRGWRILHVTWSDLETRPREIVAEVRPAPGEPGQLRLTRG
jgi:hypothetical protein